MIHYSFPKFSADSFFSRESRLVFLEKPNFEPIKVIDDSLSQPENKEAKKLWEEFQNNNNPIVNSLRNNSDINVFSVKNNKNKNKNDSFQLTLGIPFDENGQKGLDVTDFIVQKKSDGTFEIQNRETKEQLTELAKKVNKQQKKLNDFTDKKAKDPNVGILNNIENTGNGFQKNSKWNPNGTFTEYKYNSSCKNGVCNSQSSIELSEGFLSQYLQPLTNAYDKEDKNSRIFTDFSEAQKTHENILVIKVQDGCEHCKGLIDKKIAKEPMVSQLKNKDFAIVLVSNDSPNIPAILNNQAGTPQMAVFTKKYLKGFSEDLIGYDSSKNYAEIINNVE